MIDKLLQQEIDKSSSDKEVAVLLSGGVDSLSVAFAAQRLGKKITAYTFHLEGQPTYDAKKASEVSKLFGVWGLKKFMGREYMGVNRATFLVDEKGKIFKIYPKVKPAGHSKEVLDDFNNEKGVQKPFGKVPLEDLAGSGAVAGSKPFGNAPAFLLAAAFAA